MERITALYIGRVGDVIVATSFLRAIRRRYPKARIRLIVGWRSAQVLPLIPFIDEWAVLEKPARVGGNLRFAWNILRGRMGRAMIAIRDQHIAAEAMGIHTAMVKSMPFGISAMYTGIAGALGAIAIQFVAPDSFNIFVSIVFLVGIVIGGLASISGAIYGALFIQFVPNIADAISKAAPWAIFGIFLLGFVYLMPMGVAGAVRMAVARLTRKAQNPKPPQ